MRTDALRAGLRRIAMIVRKELVDLFRDRRTMMVMLVTSIAAGPILLSLVLNLSAKQQERGRELKLPVIGREHAPALMAFLERQQVTLVPPPADYEGEIRRGDLDIVVEVEPRFGADIAEGKSGTVRLIYDRSRDRARASIDQTEDLLRTYNREWGRVRLLMRGVAPEVGNPLRIEVRDLATPQSSGSIVLFLIAYYGLFAAVMGGMAAALDATAGERERQSLEPLLMTPARPIELAVGKWLAVCVLNALAVTLTLGGFYLTLRYGPLPAVGIPFLFGARELGRFMVVLVPLILLMPALLLYVGSRGRTFKEAQSTVSVLLFLVSMIPLVQLFLQKREPPWLTLVPVSSQYALLNRALRGDALPTIDLLLSYLAPLALAVGALLLVARLISKESVLAGK